MNITFNAPTWSGTPDAEDILAAKSRIIRENVLRAEQGQLPLPMSTGVEVVSSYQAILKEHGLVRVHQKAIRDSKTELSDWATSEQIDQLKEAVINRRAAGHSIETILTDLQS